MSNKHYLDTKNNVSNTNENPEIVETENTRTHDETEVETSKPVFGVVSDCEKLNIRENPDKGSNSLCIVDAGTELMVDLEMSTDEWYHVYNSSGLDGYCIKRFIKIK